MKITYDGPLDIATGKSRKQSTWKNKKALWSEILNKVKETHRTAETYADYMSFAKDRQDEIKDVGGFVGGYLQGGKRGNGHVVHRSLLTLDIDKATFALWDTYQMFYPNAAAVYSTHKHTDKAPRLRLLIPLSREIFAEEYEPICRRIAESLDIEAFTDTTTYEATRLMYWPSTSKDGAYFFSYQDGPFLDPDEILNTYTDWKDSSAWPVCSGEKDKVRHEIKKQENPLEKGGIIGAFCRTYGITEAIELFLPDEYVVTADANRYTYSGGSTAGSLVLYDDIYAFSHHGSDPVSGKLCNAYDLVRIHKYGLLDEKLKNGSNSASMEAMNKLCRKDKQVVKQLGIERLAAAKEDFLEMAGAEPGEKIAPEEAEDSLEWLADLDIDKKGNYTSSIDNVYRVLKNDKKLAGKLYFDEFENWLKIKGNLPWRVVRKDKADFSDDDIDCLAHYVECYNVPFTNLMRALSLVRNATRVHPVRDYINSLFWDGEERLETLFIDYLGAPDNAYVRSATRKTFVAAIARVFEPGVKFDTMLVLVGEEGIGKSTVIRKMAGKWFSDCLGDIHDKSGMESLRGVWFMEVSELSGFRRAEEEAIKRFITSTEDVYRPAYGRQLVRFPRQNIFFGTSNKEGFLKAGHVNRRYLPVPTDKSLATKDFFKQLGPAEVGQLWAEAYTYYQAGESLDLTKEVKELAAKIREDFTEQDDRAGMVKQFLDMKLPEGWEELNINERVQFIRYGNAGEFDEQVKEGTIERKAVCIPELWCELMEKRPGDMNNGNTKYLHDIMSKMKGWQRGKKRRFGMYGPQVEYYKSRVQTN